MYTGKTFHRETVYVCGDYLDGAIHPVFQAPGKRRSKCKPTTAIQERLNQRNAERKLARLIHANFTDADLALHLTYAPGREPEDEAAAQRDARNFLRRLKRRYAKLGIDLKYISCIEYGKRSGRAHHHLIISGGLDRDEIERLWGKGYANSKRLQFGEHGVTGLAHYIAKSHHFHKRWNRSRNLVDPEPVQRDGWLTMDDVEELTQAVDDGTAYQIFEDLYPDFELISAEWDRNEINRGAYIRYEMRRKGPQKGGTA